MSTLAERVNRRMEDLKLSQAALARMAKVKPPSVVQWRNNHTKELSGPVLLRAAQALQCRAQWLATGVGPVEEDIYQHPAHRAHEVETNAFAAPKRADPAWPFHHISLAKLGALTQIEAMQLEGAWRTAAKQLNLDIETEAPVRGNLSARQA